MFKAPLKLVGDRHKLKTVLKNVSGRSRLWMITGRQVVVANWW